MSDKIYLDKTGLRVRREWRGLRDTMVIVPLPFKFDFGQTKTAGRREKIQPADGLCCALGCSVAACPEKVLILIVLKAENLTREPQKARKNFILCSD